MTKEELKALFPDGSFPDASAFSALIDNTYGAGGGSEAIFYEEFTVSEPTQSNVYYEEFTIS